MTLAIVDAYVKTGNSSNLNINSNDFFAASLLKDRWFLNEIRKSLVFIKLLNQQTQQANFNQLPVLPLRSLSYHKDLIAELFSIVTRIIQKINCKFNKNKR